VWCLDLVIKERIFLIMAAPFLFYVCPEPSFLFLFSVGFSAVPRVVVEVCLIKHIPCYFPLDFWCGEAMTLPSSPPLSRLVRFWCLPFTAFLVFFAKDPFLTPSGKSIYQSALEPLLATWHYPRTAFFLPLSSFPIVSLKFSFFFLIFLRAN